MKGKVISNLRIIFNGFAVAAVTLSPWTVVLYVLCLDDIAG